MENPISPFLFQTGSSFFSETAPGGFQLGPRSPRLKSGPIAAADVNSDGKQDLIVETANKGLVEVLSGNGDCTFGVPQVYFLNTPSGGDGASRRAIGDVNGDGILDIVTPDPYVLLGEGDGIFADPVPYPASLYWNSVQLADLRGDGRLDVVGSVGAVTNTPNYSTTILLNAGDGKFGDGENIKLNIGNCIAVADFNEDGLDDAAVSVQDGVDIFVGTGQAKNTLRFLSSLPFPRMAILVRFPVISTEMESLIW